MSTPNLRAISVALLASVVLAVASAVLIFSGLAPPFAERTFPSSAYGASQFTFQPIDFDEIDGWRSDQQKEALPVFLRSCERMANADASQAANPVEALGAIAGVPSIAGRVGDWRGACAEAERVSQLPYADESAQNHIVRQFFEQAFVALRVIDRREPLADGPARGLAPWENRLGRFTGYFEPLYPARREKIGPFEAPVYARPDDLVMVDLGRFREELAGQRIAGAVKNGVLVPYPDHRAINEGALTEKARVIGWMRPTDLLFLQIQGSGKLRFGDRSVLRIGYDGQNGHPYTAVGRVLIEDGEVAREDMSMQAIRDWLDRAPPRRARALREANASYVFFRELSDLPDPDLGPVGANGVQLTSGRSLAVDRRYHPMGAPVWVSIPEGQAGLRNGVKRLYIAQDTGGAIRGPVRGDIYVGSGPQAGATAGRLNVMGEMVVLVPVDLADRLSLARL